MLIGALLALLVVLYVASYRFRARLKREALSRQAVAPVPVEHPAPPIAPIPPQPRRDDLAVIFESNDGQRQFARVNRRTHRLFFEHHAWDHTATLDSGEWLYHITDGPTPRQIERLSRVDGA